MRFQSEEAHVKPKWQSLSHAFFTGVFAKMVLLVLILDRWWQETFLMADVEILE